MRKLISLVILLLIVFTNTSVAQKQHSSKASVKGRVFDANSNEPLPFTNLIIFGTQTGTTSDLDGNFIFTDLHPGYLKVMATSVGYETYISQEIMVNNSKVISIDIAMIPSNIQLEGITVKASPFRKTEESPVSLRSLGIQELERSPGGNRDVSKVIQSLPGVSSTVAYRNDVIVRGGGPSENKFYLDGMEIPNLNHFATQGASGGPVGMVNIDFVREVDFYSGAFPVNRGNALSSILEMKLIDGNPDKIVTKAALGATDLSLALNGPITDKSTFLFSVRRSYLQFLFDVIGLPFLPTYNDFQFKVKTKFDQKNELTILGLGAIDQFDLNTGLENPDENQQYILDYLPDLSQWNYAIGAVYKHYRKQSYDTWVYSRNMLNNEYFKHEDNDRSKPKTSNYVSQEIENKLRYERIGNFGLYKVIGGAGLEYAKFSTTNFQKVFIPTMEDTIRSINFGTAIDLFKWNLFGQVSRGYFNDRLTVSLGLRADASNYSGELSNIFKNWAPRLSLAYAVNEKVYLNGNIGRYLQLPAYTTLGFKSNDGRYVNKDNKLEYLKADHAVLGVEYRRVESSRITLEGFYKYYTDYPVSVNDSIALANKGGDYGVYGNEEVTSTGVGRAYGIELYVRERLMNKINIIGSYTLVRSEFKNTLSQYVPSNWDSRHILNMTFAYEFDNAWNIGIRWRYVGGSPYTPYDLDRSSFIDAYNVQPRGYLDYSRFNTERLQGFNQLDVRVDKEFYYDRWSLTLYLDLQNALNYQVAEQPFIVVDKNQDGSRRINPADPSRYLLKEVASESGTILPSIGIIVEF